MVAKNNHPEPAPQAKQKHPDELQRDLNPNHMAGQNIGGGPSPLDPSAKLASDIEELTRQHHDFTADELREIPVLLEGARLLEDAVYVDLADPERRVPGDRADAREAGTVPGAQIGYPAHVLDSVGTNQRFTATAVTRPSDAG